MTARSPKARGTSHETAIVATLNAHGIPARRLAEGGNRDEGDIEAILSETYVTRPDGTIYAGGPIPYCDDCRREPEPDIRVVIEAKDSQALNAHATYADARTKTSAPLILAWRRMKPLTETRKRRTSAGTLWIVDTPTLMRLLGRTD